MGYHLTRSTALTFLQMATAVVEKGSSGTLGRNRPITSPGLDLDGPTRHLRIMEKHGYVVSEKYGSEHRLYTLTPKGVALYDYYQMLKFKPL